MVKKINKVILKTTLILAVILSSASLNTYAVQENVDFQVNIKEILSVSVTTPTDWATGNIDVFLRNPVSVSVTSNNSAGFTATMSMKTPDTFLTNMSKNTATLPTLTANSTRGNFPANYWGYSLDDTAAGSASSTYRALVGSNATPITLLQSSSATTGSKDFYFGAKGNAALPAGTYTGTVVINVVSGVIDNNNPITPTNPATPTGPNEVATYNYSPTGGSSNGTTTYTYQRTNAQAGTTTTTTEVTDGNNVGSYQGYTPPQGVSDRTVSSIGEDSPVATGLAVTASVAAASGMIFFIIAKRKKDDEEEEEDEENMV